MAAQNRSAMRPAQRSVQHLHHWEREMQKLLNLIADLLHDDAGVTSIEYALLGMLIAVAIVGSVSSVGDAVKTLYESIAAKMP
ncbi:Flp family type IVb pilin [Cupriavidus pinatubonensis]|uniref:Flp family type IVb pilin n=1 Tax=Cupriavidus pinatubonensis TaxID=248026 RepID=UPI00360F2133